MLYCYIAHVPCQCHTISSSKATTWEKGLQLVKLQVALYSGTKATMRVKSFPLKSGCQTLLVSSERQGPKTKTRPV